MRERSMNRRLFVPGLLLMALCLLLFAAGPVLGQEMGAVRGKILDWEGKPLPGVAVKLISYASGQTLGGMTGVDGSYQLDNVPVGEYRLIASLDGHADYDQAVEVIVGDPVLAEFTMYPGAIKSEITVTAAKGQRAVAELPLVVSVMTARDLEQRRPSSPQEAYESVPNMRSIGQDPHRARPQLRGLAGSRVLVLLDGERLNNSRMSPASDGISPSMIDISQIDSIEVVGGASSSLYGSDAIGGTINIVTKSPFRPAEGTHQRLRVDMDYRSSNGYTKPSLAYEYGSDKWAMRFNYAHFDTDPWKSGGRNIGPTTILPLADFAREVSAFQGEAESFVQAFAVYNLPGGDEIPYGSGSGYNAQADIWYFPAENQQIRFRYLTSQHDDLELAFRGPPTDRLFQNNLYRNMDKFGLSYEATWLTDWLPNFKVSFYQQTFDRAAENLNHRILQGSSWDQGDDDEFYFTGGLSEFEATDHAVGLIEIEQMGLNFQGQFEPWKNAILTVGAALTSEDVVDSRTEEALDGDGMVISSVKVVTIPDTEYENTGLFAQLEWKMVPWLRLTTGARWDKWKTQTSPTEGYPAGQANSTLQGYLPQILANPGDLDATGLSGLAGIGESGLTTDNDVVTSNIGLTFLLPGGFNPYVRWADSYREPDMSARYLIRDFGSRFFGVVVIPNLNLEPEEGTNIEAGLKINRGRWHAQLGYFNNDLKNFMGFISSPLYFGGEAPAAPAAIFYQRANLAEAEIKGYEALVEGVLPLGRAGSITASLSASWLEGTNKDPSAGDIATMEEFFGRDDTYIRFEGSADDVPLAGMIPFQAFFSLRYTSIDAAWFAQYDVRHVGEISRISPSTLTDFETSQFGPLQSLYGFTRHSVRVGYDLNHKKDIPLRFVVGIENLWDDLYFDPFQLAPGPGRTFTVGLTYDWRKQQ